MSFTWFISGSLLYIRTSFPVVILLRDSITLSPSILYLQDSSVLLLNINWWFLVTIPLYYIIANILPWVIGPLGVPPTGYAMGIIYPSEMMMSAGKGKGRVFYFICWLIASLYYIVLISIFGFNLFLVWLIIGKPL